MVKEIDYQTKIRKAIEAEGGFCRKWASTWVTGVPDLVAVLPEIGPFFPEVKLHKFNGNKPFHRQIGTTPLQRKVLHDINNAGGIACVFVVLRFSRDDWCIVAMDATDQHISSMDIGQMPTIKWQREKTLSIVSLMQQVIERRKIIK